MILFKKSHAEQLLHLALALSLLRSNPSNYRGAFAWHRPLAPPPGHGGGIQMAMQTLPLHDDSYISRKAFVPSIIEDLIHIHRFPPGRNSYDIQTYLLNIQNEQNGAEVPDETHPPAAAIIDPHHQQPNHTTGLTEFDLFLHHPDPFADSASLADLNLADLRDYSDDLILAPSTATPLKDEVPDVLGLTNPFGWRNFLGGQDNDDESAAAAAGTSFTSGFGSSFGALNQSDDELGTGELGRIINWEEFHAVDGHTKVKLELDEKAAVVATAGRSGGSEALLEIKTEDEVKSENDESDSTSSGFVSTVELTQEVIRINEQFYE